MPSLKRIRQRISSVKSTQKIARAMKMVAGARLTRAQQRIQALRPYAIKTQHVLAEVSLADCIDGTKFSSECQHPLLQRRPIQKVLCWVVSSDRRLCGAFNTNLGKTALRVWQERDPAVEPVASLADRGGTLPIESLSAQAVPSVLAPSFSSHSTRKGILSASPPAGFKGSVRPIPGVRPRAGLAHSVPGLLSASIPHPARAPHSLGCGRVLDWPILSQGCCRRRFRIPLVPHSLGCGRVPDWPILSQGCCRRRFRIPLVPHGRLPRFLWLSLQCREGDLHRRPP
ncbi:F0F1 ATP synthase subunit gamma [Myxococcota bacterium]